MSDVNAIDIGIVNNMADAAVKATERQFLSLIEDSAGDTIVRIQFYALPGVARSSSMRRHIAQYKSVDDLWSRSLDGIIVTGAEPRAEELKKETYWHALAKLVDWAENNTASAIWSCLAAHAAVLHLDGVHRRRLTQKRVGVYDCTVAGDHAMITGMPAHIKMPHSRWNDLDEQDLNSTGYSILIRSNGGVDAFIKQRRSLFLFFQCHPEYEAETLLLEYRRDARRFLTTETPIYPALPYGYFNAAASAELTGFQERAIAHRSQSLMKRFPVIPALANTWRSAAIGIYRNWFAYLARQKSQKPFAFVFENDSP
jgi:homoserine O-succinyltransferase